MCRSCSKQDIDLCRQALSKLDSGALLRAPTPPDSQHHTLLRERPSSAPLHPPQWGQGEKAVRGRSAVGPLSFWIFGLSPWLCVRQTNTGLWFPDSESLKSGWSLTYGEHVPPGDRVLHRVSLKACGGTTDRARTPEAPIPASPPTPQPGTLWPHWAPDCSRRFTPDFHLHFSASRGLSVQLTPFETQPGYWPRFLPGKAGCNLTPDLSHPSSTTPGCPCST